MDKKKQSLIFKTAMLAAREGAKVAQKYFRRLKSVDIKKGAGLVSEADRESEEVIQKIVHKKYPHHKFLGEEGGYQEGKPSLGSADEGLWVVDPIDGTTNYVHGFPFYAVSIGFEYKGVTEVGVIYAPQLKYLFTACRGGGAFWNGKKISVSGTDKIEDSLLATGFSYMRSHLLKEEIERFRLFAQKARGLRRAGSAALDMCMVAAGIFDGFWERELAPWDTCAGSLIVREAGGLVRNFSGEEFHYNMKSVIAGNPLIMPELLATIKGL